MQKRAFGLAMAVLLFAGTGMASQRPGAVFLMIWPAARPTAMGGAFTPIADDASSVYYNQGGMAFMEGTHATLMHANWLPGLYPGMYYEYLGVTHQIKDRGTVGLNVIYLTTGETEVVNERGDYLGRYTTFDVAVAGGYGFPVLSNLGVGLSAKFIYSFLVPAWVWEAMPELGIDAGGTGITWAVDAGVLYKPWSFLNVGVGLSNIGPNISYTSSGESDPLPRMLRIGLAYYPLLTENFSIGLVPEVNKTLVGMFFDTTGTKTTMQLLQQEWRDAWKSFGVEGKFHTEMLGVSVRGGYFEDLEGARGGIVVEREEGGQREHVSLIDALTRRGLGRVTKVGVCFGGGIEYAKFKFDVSVDQFIFDSSTNNYKFSFSYQF